MANQANKTNVAPDQKTAKKFLFFNDPINAGTLRIATSIKIITVPIVNPL